MLYRYLRNTHHMDVDALMPKSMQQLSSLSSEQELMETPVLLPSIVGKRNPPFLNYNDKSHVAWLLKQDVEVCGQLERDYYDTSKILMTELNPGSKDRTGKRGMCSHLGGKIMHPNIFHTHPQTSRSYPSAEDINRLIHHPEVYESHIITWWGIWILTRELVHYQHHIPIENFEEMYTGEGTRWAKIAELIHEAADDSAKIEGNRWKPYYEKDSVIPFVNAINACYVGVQRLEFHPHDHELLNLL
jgi:hypothetical protein